ncbi:MAG: NAD kinase [Bacteroidales bacterium]|nr:NAD kinase [Bacteroidales bacterium]
MKIALYGTEVREEFLPIYKRLFEFAKTNNIDILLHEKIENDLRSLFHYNTGIFEKFRTAITQTDIHFLLSIGGDGTFLSAVPYSLEMMIPIAGINCGRLGFLADITDETLEDSLQNMIEGNYTLEKRSMLELISPKAMFGDINFAVNELTVHKLDNSSMIKIETYINGEFLVTYWADGLIIATPTGSTAYSLSVGGPVVTPNVSGLVITPIASHNLTVRPVVVPDDVEIELIIEGRGNQFLVSVDHRSVPLDFSTSIKIKKASVTVPTVKFNGHTFYSTLRNKMMWGADKRN